jgi:hypothetical protein
MPPVQEMLTYIIEAIALDYLLSPCRSAINNRTFIVLIRCTNFRTANLLIRAIQIYTLTS